MNRSWPVLLALWLGLLAGAFPARGTLNLVTRETFYGFGTLDGGSPGNLGAVMGTFAKRPGGPRLTGDNSMNGYGWSGDLRPVGCGVQSISGLNLHVVTQWVYLTGALDPSRFSYLLRTQASALHGYEFLSVGMMPNGNTGLSLNETPFGPYTDLGTPFPLLTWVELRVAWRQVASGTYQRGAYMRVAGASVWTTLFEDAASGHQNQFGDGLGSVTFGLFSGQNGPGGPGRIGMPSLYAMDSWADRLAPVPDVADPAAGPHHWYCNAATGNDGNDGTSPATAWASVTQINTESQYLGMFPTANGYATGDTLTINTGTANLPLGTASLNLNTRGLNVVQTGNGEIQAWAPLANAGFSLVAGAAKTYGIVLSEANPSCVAWENDRWLNHIRAASFTSVAYDPTGAFYPNATAALEAVPGSFWTDGVTLYVHPSGDTNPAGDGKVYTRSYHRGAPYGAAAVVMLAPDLHLNGLRVRKTCLADPYTNDPVGAYCLQSQSGGGGTSLIENGTFSYGSKHIVGFTDEAAARRFTVRNCTANQGSPYCGAGGQTPWVDYSDLSGTQDNQTLYDHCATTVTEGLVGATTGQTRPGSTLVWTCHGSGLDFSLIRWQDCAFDTPLYDQGTCAAIQLYRTVCAGGSFDSPATIDQCVSTYAPFVCQQVGNSVQVTNSLILSDEAFYAGNNSQQCAGTLIYRGCTIDLSAASSGNGLSGGDSFLTRSGVLALTVQNCLFISPPDGYSQLSLIHGATSGDTLKLDHNAYLLGSNLILAAAYDDGTTVGDRTLAQWQALGFDAHSMLLTDARLDSGDRPLADSPLIDAGGNLGPQADLSGTFFAVRDDIGAYEYPLPVLRAPPASAAGPLTEGGSVSFGVRLAGNGPFTYQWQDNGVAIAGATGATLTLNNLLPGQSGSYAVVVSNAQGGVVSQAAALFVQPMTYAQWLAAAGVNPGAAGAPGSLLAYALGVTPGQAAAGASPPPPQASLSQAADGAHFTLGYRRLINFTGLAYTVESSRDLVTWDGSGSGLATVGNPVPTGDGRTELVTCRWQAPVQGGAGGRAFLRLRVSLLP